MYLWSGSGEESTHTRARSGRREHEVHTYIVCSFLFLGGEYEGAVQGVVVESAGQQKAHC